MVDDNVLYVEDFQYLISNARGSHVRSICPICNERRSNKKDRCLSIDVNNLLYHCHYCNAKGKLRSKVSEVLSKEQRMFKPKKIEYVKPKPKDKEKEKVFGDSFLEYFKNRGISEKTLIEARVTQETEYMPNIGKAGVIAFNFYVGEELVNVKFRSRDKQFKLVSGAKLVPYNINSIMPESYKDCEEKIAILTEGEGDCLTWIECGYKHVVSLPNGANNLGGLDDFIESVFDKLDWLYISVDNDAKGLECRSEIIRRFGKENCKIIDYPAPCKDINEVMVEYGREKVIECFKNAIDLKPEGIQELVDVEANLDYLFKYGLQKGAMVNIPSVDKILSFKTGMLTVVTGVPSHGKTYLLNYLLVRLNLLHNWKMAFFSPEFYPVSLHISQVIETIGGKRFESTNYNQMVYEKMKNYLCSNMFWIDPDDTDITSVMERAKYLIKKRGIKALVIDPFNALTDKERKNQKQDEYISEFLQKLRWFARRYDVAVFLVMHPVKLNKLENGLYPICDLYSCKGASEIFDKADCGLTVWRNEKEDYAELHVTKIKFRHLGEKGFATFKFNVNNGRYVEIGEADELRKNGIDIKTMQVEWDNSNYILERERGNQVQSNIVYKENIQPNASFTPQPVKIEEPTQPPLRTDTFSSYIPKEYIEPQIPNDYDDDCPF